MAKQTLYGSGKNAVQQTDHIRSTKVLNSAGFSSGGPSTTSPFSGAPLRNGSQVSDGNSVKSAHWPAGNPYNEHARDESGVLGGGIKAQNAGRYADSPVPSGATLPDKNQMSKAAESASAPAGTISGDGVLGRG